MSFNDRPVPQPTEKQYLQIAQSNDEAMARKIQLLTPQQRQQYEEIVSIPVHQRPAPKSPWQRIEFTPAQEAAMQQIDAQHSERIQQIMNLHEK